MHVTVTAALLVIAVTLAGCGTDANPTEEEDGTPTAATPEGTTPATPAGGDSPTTPEAAGALEGSASCEDETGDPEDGNSEKPDTIPPGQDLTGAELRADGEALTVTWRTDQAVSASTDESDGLFWSADLWSDENTGYAVRVALDGSTWTAEVASFVDDITFTPLDTAPVRNGNELTVRVPLDHLPELAGTFRWYVTTEWGGATFYNDSCPGGGSPTVDPSDQLEFPAS